jgi:transcriptional regulator with XRE-family HTH domain
MSFIGRAIQHLRKDADLSQETVADRMGITRQAWQQYEAGERQVVMRSDVQDQIAEALGTTRATLLMVKARLAGESFTPPDGRPSAGSGEVAFLSVSDPVRAGAFLAVDDTDQSAPRLTNIGRDPRYPLAQQRIRPVVGDSMNLRGILDGDWVHLASVEGMNFAPETGMIVEVERTRVQGRERELTLKELEVTTDGLLLWPRSTNPLWRDPLTVTDGDEEDVTVQITGVMLQLIRRF